MSKKYTAAEVISDSGYVLADQQLSQILKALDPMIRDFCSGNPLTRWVNVGFSNDGVTESNIAISLTGE